MICCVYSLIQYPLYCIKTRSTSKVDRVLNDLIEIVISSGQLCKLVPQLGLDVSVYEVVYLAAYNYTKSYEQNSSQGL